jgi:ATP-dependent helicase/nuclease subunit B
MPGRQLEFFNRICSAYSPAVFAPYKDCPSYRFAEKFFKSNWLGLSKSTQNVDQNDFGALGPSGEFLFGTQQGNSTDKVQIWSAPNPRGEVFFVAKEILRLVEKEGYQFSDIAVLTRSLFPYQDEVRRVFKQNFIPLDASFTYSIRQVPLGVFCLNLFSLLVSGWERNEVLAIISSPFFKYAHKQHWRRLIHKSLVSRDFSQWKDLLPQTENYDSDLLTWLEDCKKQLENLNKIHSWPEASAAALKFLKDNINESAFSSREAEIFRTICEKITSLERYGIIREMYREGEFLSELTESLLSLSFNEAESIRGGVTFTDAVRGRCLQYKVVFLLGLNEKSFPVPVPEDPILRDYYRYILRDGLGYWINQKSERFDEERLLFFTAVTTPSEKLYALYSRGTEDGKNTVPSVFLAELARVCRNEWQSKNAPRISGRLSEQVANLPSCFLTETEFSHIVALHAPTAESKYLQAGLLTESKSRSLKAAITLNQVNGFTAYDGQIQSGKELFERINNGKGFSCSALQTLAGCPLKYFFEKGLHLREEDPLSRQELAPNYRGTAYHEILQTFYTELLRLGLTHNLFDTGISEYLERAVSSCYTESSYKKFGIYPVVWRVILDSIRTQLLSFVTEDLNTQGDYVPSYFEKDFSFKIPSGLPFKINGIVDRIDVDEKSKTFLVMDYKSSKKGTKNLDKDFFSKFIFQPFLYVWAAQHMEEFSSLKPAGSCLLSIKEGYYRQELPLSRWEDMRPQAEKLLLELVELIKKGTFFLNDQVEDLCKHCPFTSICRRDAFRPLMRARKSDSHKKIEEICQPWK